MASKRKPSDIGDRLRTAIAATGMKHSWIAEEAGITAATLSNILTGRVADPSFSSVIAIANAIGTPLGTLLGERSAPLPESEQDVLRRAVEILERRVLRSRVPRSRGDGLHLAAAGGYGISEADALPRHKIPTALHRRGARLVFQNIGDSMVDEGLRDGDLLYVRPTSDTRAANGQIIVCRIDGDLFVRKLIATGRSIHLYAGDTYLTISPDTSTFELLGIVVAHLGDL